MGRERSCILHYRGASYAGRAYLEADHLLFRGDIRLKILFPDLQSVKTEEGELQLSVQPPGAQMDEVRLAVGAEAAVWEQKILHPPSRLSKLGVKRGSMVTSAGDFDGDFIQDLMNEGVAFVTPEQAEALFLAVTHASNLKLLPGLARKLKAGCHLWIVYPKGVAEVREADVINAGRTLGWKDTKVVAFSKTHTALRFSRPAARVERSKQPVA